jgi:hypothetical protein
VILYTQLRALQLDLRGAQLDIWIDVAAREMGFVLAETIDAKLSRVKRYAEDAYIEMWDAEGVQ